MRFHSILVPLDGSPLAEQALPLALEIRRKSEADLHLLSVVPAPLLVDGGELPAPLARAVERAHERSLAYIDDAMARLAADADGDGVTGEVALDAPVDGILDAVRARRADLVVMTSHGRGGIARFWLGSVADGVVRRADVPVLVLRPEDELRSGLLKRPPVRSIVVPVDGSSDAEAAFAPALELASLFGASITLLLVLESPIAIVPELAPYALQAEPVVLFEQREHAERYLAGAAARLRASDVEVHTAISDENGVAKAISDFAHRNASDMIVMSTHGRGGMRRFLLGSIADKVLRQAEVPVLLVRPEQTPARVDRHRHPGASFCRDFPDPPGLDSPLTRRGNVPTP